MICPDCDGEDDGCFNCNGTGEMCDRCGEAINICCGECLDGPEDREEDDD